MGRWSDHDRMSEEHKQALNKRAASTLPPIKLVKLVKEQFEANLIFLGQISPTGMGHCRVTTTVI